MTDNLKRPVAFRVPRIVDDVASVTQFRLFTDEQEAQAAADELNLDYDGLYLVGDRNLWQHIETLPSEDTEVIAATDDGRVMIWSSAILSRVMSGVQPFHLKFPATRWMLIDTLLECGFMPKAVAETRPSGSAGKDDVQPSTAESGHKPEQRVHVLSDLEYVELIRKWRDLGFNLALETVNQFADDGVTSVLAALEDLKTMLPPLPSKGN